MTALYALPPWAVLVAAAVIAAALACGGHVAVRRAFPRVDVRAHNDDQWPAMRTGGSSKRAEDVLTRTFEGVAQFRTANAGASNAQSAALQYVGALHDARHHRLDDNNSGVSPFEWSILLIGAAVVIGICYLVGLSSLRAQLLMTGAVAAMIASTFVLIFELDYPFRGDLSVAPTGWQEFLDRNR